MADYYDRKGKKITQEKWLKLWKDPANKVVKQDIIGDKIVSTVWLGLDHNFEPDGKPLIFETMIFGAFDGGDGTEEFCRRYPNEFMALEGHAFAIKVAEGTAKPLEHGPDEVSAATTY